MLWRDLTAELETPMNHDYWQEIGSVWAPHISRPWSYRWGREGKKLKEPTL